MSDPLQDPTTPPPELLPISTAPRDGTFIIAYTKAALEDQWMGMANRPFAIKHMGRTAASGLNLGWSLFPGMGVSDGWFEGWMPITRATPTRSEGQPIPMIYRNWRGEVAQRRIRPAGLPYWGTTEWHPEPGWILPVIDTEKGEYRDFALADCDFRVARQADPGIICNGCGWEGDEDGLIATLDAQDGEPSRACPECRTDGYLMDRPAQPEADFPRPGRKDGGEPCGECRLPAGETCDICGAVAPQPEGKISAEALIDLIGELGREVYYMLDDCETSGPVGEEVHTIPGEGLTKVSAILDRIDALPFEEPGVILGTGAKLQAALKQTFMPAQPPRQALATKAMVDAAFNALPPDAHGTIGAGEMERVLDAALRALKGGA